MNNLTSDVNDGLQDIVNALIKEATDSLGLEDEYVIYLQNICKGNRADPNNPNSKINIDSCPGFKTVGDGGFSFSLPNSRSPQPMNLTSRGISTDN